MKDVKFKTIRNLFYLLKQQRRFFIIFTLVITLASILEALGIGSLYPLVNILESAAKRSTYLKNINDLLHFNLGKDQFIFILFTGLFVLFLIRGLFIIVSYYVQYKISERLKANWQIEIFKSYLNQEYDYFIRHQTGDLIQKQMAHTEMAGSAIIYSCQIATNFFTALFLYLTLCIISLKGTLLLTILILVITLFSLILSKVKIYVSSQEHARLQKQAYSITSEVIAGIRQVKAFLAEEFFKKHFSNVVKKKASIYIKNATLGQSPGPIMQTIAFLGIILALFFVTRYRGNIQGLLPLITVFGGAAYRIISSMGGINSNFMQIAHLLPSVNIVSEMIKIKPSLRDLPAIGRFKNNIKFENVSFSYLQKEFNLFDINISFEKGKFYGIVGASGSGKSTLVDLIIRFYSSENGKISIDGKNIEEIDIRSWRRQIGLISQETFIFNGTIEENISFATDASEIDKDRVVMSAKIADIHDFIKSLPEGYQSVVGERGLRLSGGQRQRLAVARAVYRDPQIYIFDEATSSLDTYSEKRIQKAIENLSRSRTVIAIAHRLSTVTNADEIIVMKEGKIIEKGNHHGLLNKGGYYAELYANQHIQGSANVEKIAGS